MLGSGTLELTFPYSPYLEFKEISIFKHVKNYKNKAELYKICNTFIETTEAEQLLKIIFQNLKNEIILPNNESLKTPIPFVGIITK